MNQKNKLVNVIFSHLLFTYICKYYMFVFMNKFILNTIIFCVLQYQIERTRLSLEDTSILWIIVRV